MPSITIITGVLLILVGIVGYIYGMMNGSASLTAFIPAVFGLIIAILGFFALSKENLRKHLMHAAVTIGLLGFLLSAGRLVLKLSTITMSAAVLSQIAMAVICLVFVLLCVKSFIDARRSGAV